MNPLENPSMISLGALGPIMINLVFIVLILMSVISWGIIIYKAMQLHTASKSSKEFSRIFWEARDLSRIESLCAHLQASPLVRVFTTGFNELSRIVQDFQRRGGTGSVVPEIGILEMALRRSELQQVQRLEKGNTFLATVASAAPFIGLFGTVLGIMDAFDGLGIGGTSTIQAVAPGISHALEATAVGLAAAIPASIAYNYINMVIRQFRENMDRFSMEFVSFAEQQYLSGGDK